jgi:hypothetical protein
MDYMPDEQVEAIKKMFPSLDENQLRDVKATLDDYSEILYRMFTRLENERKERRNEDVDKMRDREA